MGGYGVGVGLRAGQRLALGRRLLRAKCRSLLSRIPTRIRMWILAAGPAPVERTIRAVSKPGSHRPQPTIENCNSRLKRTTRP